VLVPAVSSLVPMVGAKALVKRSQAWAAAISSSVGRGFDCGSEGNDVPRSIDLGPDGRVLVAGFTSSFSFPFSGGGPGNASRSATMYLYETAWKYFRFGYASSISVVLAGTMIIVTIILFSIMRRRAEY